MNFNIVHMIQSIRVLSFLSFIILSFLPFSFAQNIPVLASGGDFKLALQSLWYNPSTLWQLLLSDVTRCFRLNLCISCSRGGISHFFRGPQELDKLKSATPVKYYNRLYECHKAFLGAEVDISKYNSAVSLYIPGYKYKV